ncbi:DUF3726 domain-containing protein [Octadecabacter sp. 1_MG-2023]|uniref:DUF3726 domain-containing protein n=1 Tax=unclassified Octadecabacter TaxID=196158 RepID=UPI001C095480|nr:MULTISPECIES: DUF3726 domain-containing protein [unclassified Octadecabacter]MBU2994640.1 DUF3726 domain-containing protein [Octadecabacter sp. B2R22]MDO6734067.1 DUF3726 domain-containing protein [Octadecabacter sp. 1_MG-2023]
MMELSANEIATLFLKAARGGSVPLGYCEDLAAAAAYLDLDALTRCPILDSAAVNLPTALDLVLAGRGPREVVTEDAMIKAYVALYETRLAKTVHWQANETGAVFEKFHHALPVAHAPLGRRAMPSELMKHLEGLAGKTLVPETETSRAGGAGAGLTDND